MRLHEGSLYAAARLIKLLEPKLFSKGNKLAHTTFNLIFTIIPHFLHLYLQKTNETFYFLLLFKPQM